MDGTLTQLVQQIIDQAQVIRQQTERIRALEALLSEKVKSLEAELRQ